MFKLKLRENEKVILANRQTQWVWGKAVLLAFILIYAPWAFYSEYELRDIVALKRILIFWTLLCLVYALNKYLLWLINAYIITNQRIVSITYPNLFAKTVEEADLSSIATIICKTQGIFEAMFKTGRVIINFSNATKTFELDRVHEPEHLKELILKAKSTGKPMYA